MTTTLSPTSRGAARHRGSLAAIGVSVLLLVGTAIVVVLLGRAPPPDWPSLAADPDPAIPGTIAYVRLEPAGDGWESGPCIGTVPASGGPPRTLHCDPAGLEDVAWTVTGQVVAVAYDDPVGPTAVVLDPESGAVVRHGRTDRGFVGDWARERAIRPDGRSLSTTSGSSDRASLSVRAPDGTRRILVDTDGPAGYRITAAAWSPDGRWVVFGDSVGRLAVVAADGSAEPRLLLDLGHELWTASQLAWYVPGDRTYTVAEPGG